jgi:hypothetical protein
MRPVIAKKAAHARWADVAVLLHRPLNLDGFAALPADIGKHRIEAGEGIQASAMRAGLAAEAAGQRHAKQRRFYFMGRHGAHHSAAFVARKIGLPFALDHDQASAAVEPADEFMRHDGQRELFIGETGELGRIDTVTFVNAEHQRFLLKKALAFIAFALLALGRDAREYLRFVAGREIAPVHAGFFSPSQP